MTAQAKYRPTRVFTEEHRERLRTSSRIRWADRAQREKVSKQRKMILPSQEMIVAYNSGQTLREVASQFRVNYMTVSRCLDENNTPRRRTGKRDQWEDKHPLWKGKNASYGAFHHRLDSRFGKPKRCDLCGTTDPAKRYDWANLTGRYHDLGDFKRMCRKCHINFDSAKRGGKRNRKSNRTSV